MAVRGKLGKDSKLYYNTGSYGSPTWTVIDPVSDLTSKAAKDKLDASSRESIAKLYLAGQIDIGCTFKIRGDRGNAAVAALLDSFFANTILDYLILNGPSTTNGCWGFRYESYLFSETESQNLGEVIFPELEITPAPTSNGPPAYALVSGGAPVFTSLVNP